MKNLSAALCFIAGLVACIYTDNGWYLGVGIVVCLLLGSDK